jgi:transcriptional regulator with XRE-family HTH domain
MVRAMKKLPNPVDRHVGARLRMRRNQAGLSQEKLGEALGVTFQQVQKYEKGLNRLGASRLQLAARVLGVPVNFFFDGMPAETEGFAEPAAPAYGLTSMQLDADSSALIAAFSRVQDPRLKARIIELVEAMATQGAA